jgi:hypothetical protein
MKHSTASAFGLQSLLFSKEEIATCFLRYPTDRELEFMSYFHGIQSILLPDELLRLRKLHNRGRIGYSLVAILGIQILKLHYRQPTMKETLLLLLKMRFSEIFWASVGYQAQLRPVDWPGWLRRL